MKTIMVRPVIAMQENSPNLSDTPPLFLATIALLQDGMTAFNSSSATSMGILYTTSKRLSCTVNYRAFQYSTLPTVSNLKKSITVESACY